MSIGEALLEASVWMREADSTWGLPPKAKRALKVIEKKAEKMRERRERLRASRRSVPSVNFQ
jgi:hypothetical protein